MTTASYAASFAEDGCRFVVPGLVGGNPAAMTLAFRAAYRMGQGAGQPPAVGAQLGVRPIADARAVRYERGAITETYSVLNFGIEQTFTFRELPPGTGDLVVQLQASTDLAPSVAGAKARELTLRDGSGIGRIHIGTVTGIDARGQRAAGWMRWTDGALELGLPDSFVDRAALPLVLDPLIGSARRAGLPNHSAGMGAAYSPSSQLFVLAWAGASFPVLRPESSSWHGMDVTAFDASGASQGFISCLECFLGPLLPQVAVVEGANLFLVANLNWADRGVILHTIGMNPFRVLGFRDLSLPLSDVAGNAVGTTAVFVGPASPSGVSASLVECAGGLPVLGRSQVIALGAAAEDVQIASTGGTGERYLVAWRQAGALSGAVLDADLDILDAGTVRPQVGDSFGLDGDGDTWLVAYTVGAAPNQDVWAVPVVWNAAAGTADLGTAFPLAADPTVAETARSVAYTDGSYLVSYSRAGTPWLVVVDPISGHICEQTELPGFGPLVGQPEGDRAFLAWTEGGPTGYLTQVFRADDGVVTDLGGGCGGGGDVIAYCAVRGNAGFELRLINAAPQVAAVAVIGLEGQGLPCGPCTFFPDPAASAVLAAGLTTQAGIARAPAPIPNVPSVVGASLVEQWLSLGGGGCLNGVSLSNGLRIQVQ